MLFQKITLYLIIKKKILFETSIFFFFLNLYLYYKHMIFRIFIYY